MNNDILDVVFEATSQLELMQTVIRVLIDMVEDEVDTPEQAMRFAANQNVINDFLHIALDGVFRSIKMLDGLQKGGAE